MIFKVLDPRNLEKQYSVDLSVSSSIKKLYNLFFQSQCQRGIGLDSI